MTPINIKLSVESKQVITEMGSMSIHGNCKIAGGRVIGLPACAPYRLKPVEHGLVGDGGGARALVGIGHGQTLLSAPVRPHTINTAAGTTGRGTRTERLWRHPGRIGSAADIAWQEGCSRT